MKQTKTILACGLVLALTGLTSMVVAAGGDRPAKATVRSIHGHVQVKTEGGDWKPLRVNQELEQGAVLKSDADAFAYLQVNGFTSTVKLTEDTTITLEKMLSTGGFGGDTTTDLKLDGGKVLGSVRKLSANSDYQVTVPNGVAGIRGTDFEVSVSIVNGSMTITFTSVTGTILCQASVPNGTTASQTLNTGQSWTITGTISQTGAVTSLTVDAPVTTLSPAELTALKVVIVTLNNGGTPVVTGTPTGTIITTLPPTTSNSDTGGNGSDNTATPGGP